MSARDHRLHEYRLRLETEAAEADRHDEDDLIEDEKRHAQRMENQQLWVDLQIKQAIGRGDFDNLPGAGKPIPGIDGPHDPDWWLKSLVERERITGVLPPALALRTEDARLDDELDRVTTADGVRQAVEDFNTRIIEARRQLQGGPPVITPLREVDVEITAWTQRRDDRVTRQQAELESIRQEAATASLPWGRRVLDRLHVTRSVRVSG